MDVLYWFLMALSFLGAPIGICTVLYIIVRKLKKGRR